MDKLEESYKLDIIKLPSFDDISEYQLELINTSSGDENNNESFDSKEMQKEIILKSSHESKKENKPNRKRVLKYLDDTVQESKIVKKNPKLKEKNVEDVPKRSLRKRTTRKIN
ncbi:hypothetical protein PVAND_013170 [Polypedilum vanderplanki]|uniref:Uncharacterized protein n=1 Tax=Polypedilum vanderplanki TaxID=319348 RepID=A0A9J6CPM2_POLVA|nr:hypothetical protein PVAND_013170 [Polypedilum vanderplanki]